MKKKGGKQPRRRHLDDGAGPHLSSTEEEKVKQVGFGGGKRERVKKE